MNGNSLFQALGLFACFGALLLLVVVAIIARSAHGGRGPSGRRRGDPLDTSVIHTPPFEDDDFGGVPTTGPVQEYERDYRPEQIIGSSGFEGQPDIPNSNFNEEERG